MVPIKLRLQNFLSYRDATIDFSGFHVACLSGANGAGKSSLLDAITWAIWERARTNDADALIRIGQQEACVEFVFRMEDEVYRIVRRRQRGRSSGVSVLELHVLGEDGVRVLSGKGVRDAQQRINQIVRMDYTTFINSAFVLQGRADEFTTRSPRERKEVLARILGLGVYDELQAAAKDELAGLRQRLAQATAHCRQLEELLAQETEAVEQLPPAREELEVASRLLRTQEQQLGGLRLEEQECRQAQQRLQEAREREAELLARREKLQAEEAEHGARLEEYARVLQEAPLIEAGYQRWCGLQEREQTMAGGAERYHQLHRERTGLADRVRDAAHELELALHRALEQRQQRQEEAGRLGEILGDAERIRRHHEELQRCREALEQYSERSTRIQQLERRRTDLERAVEMARQAAQHEEALRRAAIAERRRRLRAEPGLQAQLAGCRERLAEIERCQVELERVHEKGLLLRSQIEQLQAGVQAATAEKAVLERRLADLKACDAATCPTCHNHLRAADLAQLVEAYREGILRQDAEALRQDAEQAERERELLAMRQRYKELQPLLAERDERQRRVGELESQLKDLGAVRAEVEAMERELASWQQELAEEPPGAVPLRQLERLQEMLAGETHDANELTVLQARVQDLRWAEGRHMQLLQAQERMAVVAGEVERLGEMIAAREVAIADEAFARPEREALARIDGELAKLAYDSKAHARLRRELADGQGIAEQWQRLEGARLRREHTREVLDRCLEQLRDLAREHEQHAALLQTLGDPGARLPAIQERIALAEDGLLELQTRERGLRDRVVVLEERELRRNRCREEWDLQRRQRDELAKECGYYETLVGAFGKNGIQAVIIENALPEIEDAANRVLHRLSNGRMHVALATRKEAKSSDKVTETLEILISDELGTRNYQTFSGGEAFRVNFALRLALSKLLARRAGAKLQTLIVDEGFGTLDDDGRKRLVEALQAIQDDFEKILIITHIEELKQTFPARIEVSKEHDGSSVSIHH